jgi:hypothetical protein
MQLGFAVVRSGGRLLKSVEDAVNSYVRTNTDFTEDIVVDYTTVHLIDDTTGIKYMVGINDNKLYIKEV